MSSSPALLYSELVPGTSPVTPLGFQQSPAQLFVLVYLLIPGSTQPVSCSTCVLALEVHGRTGEEKMINSIVFNHPYVPPHQSPHGTLLLRTTSEK